MLGQPSGKVFKALGIELMRLELRRPIKIEKSGLEIDFEGRRWFTNFFNAMDLLNN